MNTTDFAIVNDVRTDRKLVAICEWRSYDVWGNARDGYEVNDSFSQGEITIPAEMRVSNVPRLPGASDAYRSFPADSASFSAEVVVTFQMTDKAIRRALGIKCAIDVEGDDIHYQIERARDGYPLAELTVLRFEEAS